MARDCDVLGGQDNQRTIGGVCYDGTQGENAKVGEKGRLVFSVHGIPRRKRMESGKRTTQLLGDAAVFAARSIVKPRQLFAQKVKKDARGSSRPRRAADSNRRQMVHKETKKLYEFNV
ncbi:hypothetical protein OIU85_021807 [Salix viminalis]|uniref:Uncharacterized protein n=1 Tax=Salix viminalis TaxID=40686 RepID=A0A9Q0UJ50_SALVM|nr:hypothetical protein OIU85_021807 [Salix viminalis]